MLNAKRIFSLLLAGLLLLTPALAAESDVALPQPDAAVEEVPLAEPSPTPETSPAPSPDLPPETSPAPSPDVSPEPVQPVEPVLTDVEYCVAKGIIKPEDDPFSADAPISKIQFITMVSRAYGLFDDTSLPFSTAKADHFAHAGANALFDAAKFPESEWANPLTRYEAATICYQALSMFSGCAYDGNFMYVNTASDRIDIPKEYLPVVNRLYALGITNGVDEFRAFHGWQMLYGAQAAALVRRLLEPSARVALVLPDDFTQLFSSCTTKYGGGISGYSSPYRENRIHNILKAGGVINEVVVQPGETFSYNAHVGNAGKAQGYLMATVLNNGEATMGYGGGICQVSSMVFSAALNANMTILERYNHSIRSLYMAAGTDSTVFYDSLDLKWRNDYGCPVKLVFAHDQTAQSVTVSLYGSAYVYRLPVTVDVVRSKRDPNAYTLTRTVDGEVNYTCFSKYRK